MVDDLSVRQPEAPIVEAHSPGELTEEAIELGIVGTAEGKTKPEIMRCLKRYLTREVYRLLVPTPG